jgi:hypothetical protein
MKQLWVTIFILLIVLLPGVIAEEDEDIELFGLELEKMLHLFGGVLATFLATFTGVAYIRTNNNRLKYVFIAFVLFAIKGFLAGAEIFFGEWGGWLDPTNVILEFAILLSFFIGMIKR